MKILLSCLSVLCLFSAPVWAQEAAAEKDIAKETPITKWVEAENALLETLPPANQEVLFVFRNKHSVMRSIEVVHRDIKNAVKACGKENSDMKSAMNTRLKEWEGAVFPILNESKKFLKQELKEQEAFHISDYTHVMKLNDKAFEFSETMIKKEPVTSKEACEGLLNSMDSTEDKLVGLLQNILLPEEVVRERLEQAKKSSKAPEKTK